MASDAEDDELVLSSLLAGDDISESLPALLSRFREDHGGSQVVERLIERTQYPGLSYTTNATPAAATPQARALPPGCEESTVTTLVALLGVPRTAAIGLLHLSDPGASTRSDGARAVSFLGDRIVECVDLHHRQRVARIDTVAELLRKDPSEALQVLDAMTTSHGSRRSRGLLRLLLAAACQEGGGTTTQQHTQRSTTQHRNLVPHEMNDVTWDKMVHGLAHSQHMWKRREITSALQAILFLLYNRVEVERADLALLLTALNELEMGREIGAVILAESIALWRIFPSADENRDQSQHPLLVNDDADNSGLLDLVARIRNSKHQELALLSVGLLMHAAGGDALRSRGFQIASEANGDFDAFGTLHTLMETLVSRDPKVPKQGFDDLVPYDCRQFLSPSDFEIEEQESELSVSSLAIASVGHEILYASLLVFGDKLLPRMKLPQTNNMARVASLVVAVFQNSPSLSSKFWSDWESNPELPFGRLLESSYRLAGAALDAATNGFKNRDEVLLSLTPFLQIVSALVYDADIVEEVLENFVPDDLVRACLDLAKLPGTTETSKSCRAKIISSISTLISIGCKKDTGRDRLRTMLESQEHDRVSGPEALAGMVPMCSEATIPLIFSSLADLVDGSSVEWLLNAVKAVHLVQQDSIIWRGMFEHGDAEPMARLVLGLLQNLPTLVFDTRESEAERVLEILKLGVGACYELLVVSRPQAHDFMIAAVVLDVVSAALRNLRSIMELHASERVYAAASAFLDELVATLTTRLGSSVVFFATYPTILSVVAAVDSTTSETSSGEFLLPHLRGSTINLEEHLVKQLKTLNKLDLKMDSFEKRGVRMGDTTLYVHASLSAIRLLSWWGKTIEVKGSFSLDLCGSVLVAPQSLEEIIAAGPLRFLHTQIPLPQGIRADSTFVAAWECLHVTPLSLLVGLCRTGRDDMSMALATETMDLLSLLFYTCSTNAERSVYFFRTLNRFSCFVEVVGEFVGATTAVESTNMTRRDFLAASVSVRFFRLLGSFLEPGILSPTDVLQAHCSSSLEAFVSLLKVVLPAILDSSVSLEDKSFLSRLRLASGSSFCFGLIWRSVRSGSDGSGIDFENKQLLFELLLNVLFEGSSIRVNHFEDGEASGRCALLSTFANIFEILGTELAWASSNFQPSLPICKAIEKAIEGDLRKVTSVALSFQGTVTIDRFDVMWESFARNCKTSCKVPDLANRGMLFYALAGPSCHPGTVYFTDSIGRDIHVSQLYSGIFDQDFSHFHELELFNTITHIELVSQSAWGRFFFVLLETVSKLRDHGANFAMTPSDFASTHISKLFNAILSHGAVGRELVAATKQTTTEFTWLMEKQWINSSRVEMWVDTLESTANLKAGTRDFISAADNFGFVANRLRIALFLMDAKQAQDLNYRDSADPECARIQTALSCMVEMACASIMRLARSREQNSVGVVHFPVYFSFLLLSADYGRGFPGLLDELCVNFVESELLPSLVGIAVALEDRKEKVEVIESVMDFLTQLVPLSSCGLLDYLAANGISLVQISGLLVSEAERNGVQARRVAKEHPRKKFLDFVVDCIESSTLRKFKDLARAVIRQHEQEFVTTLSKCLQVEVDFGPQTSRGRSFALTLPLVREAQSILSVVSELSALNPRVGDQWQCTQAAFAERIYAVIPVLSTYLASTGSAREIFFLCDQAESTGAMNIDSPYCNHLDHLSRLVATGPQNAKHDAIRYTANFVLNVFQSVTDDDERRRQMPGGRLGRETDGISVVSESVSDSLEKRCRNGVSSTFSLETEKQVAVCLFHAFRFLKKIHPAQDSFVMFTAEDLRTLHPFEIVNPGMCIAFRPHGTNDVHCGKVLASNGLKGTWQAHRVWPLPPTTDEIEIEVSASQFLGVQDPEKRIALVPRVEAPDSSVELEALTGNPASTAHLVLCLRWCRYFFNELKCGFGDQHDEHFVKRFAELTSGLLSMELSVHNHISSSVASFRLDCQLLDLYGEPHEILERVSGSSTENDLEGKLKPLLSKISWDSARFHLRAYLNRAIEHLSEAKKRESPRHIPMRIAASPFR